MARPDRRAHSPAVFDFQLRIFALSFAMVAVTGIVMAFKFGTNWTVLSARARLIQGPVLDYKGFAAFILEGESGSK